MDSGWTWSRALVASAALRVMVVQRVRISSVLGLGGTLGATETVSLPLRLPDPELSVLMSEPRRSERLVPELLCPLSLMLDRSACSSPFKLEYDSLLEEKSERLESPLVLLMLRARPSEVVGPISIWVCDQVSERTFRDWALWRRLGAVVSLMSLSGSDSSLMLGW